MASNKLEGHKSEQDDNGVADDDTGSEQDYDRNEEDDSGHDSSDVNSSESSESQEIALLTLQAKLEKVDATLLDINQLRERALSENWANDVEEAYIRRLNESEMLAKRLITKLKSKFYIIRGLGKPPNVDDQLEKLREEVKDLQHDYTLASELQKRVDAQRQLLSSQPRKKFQPKHKRKLSDLTFARSVSPSPSQSDTSSLHRTIRPPLQTERYFSRALRSNPDPLNSQLNSSQNDIGPSQTTQNPSHYRQPPQRRGDVPDAANAGSGLPKKRSLSRLVQDKFSNLTKSKEDKAGTGYVPSQDTIQNSSSPTNDASGDPAQTSQPFIERHILDPRELNLLLSGGENLVQQTNREILENSQDRRQGLSPPPRHTSLPRRGIPSPQRRSGGRTLNIPVGSRNDDVGVHGTESSRRVADSGREQPSVSAQNAHRLQPPPALRYTSTNNSARSVNYRQQIPQQADYASAMASLQLSSGLPNPSSPAAADEQEPREYISHDDIYDD
ncbi:hypothetical protein JR316_0008938 [Psilocybe cubensis]|uniref:Uncharacterized protein n=1 Tax=Psilocybe cubensis TaxID=181762 RepID=A0ACB8GSH5_PSICU|nr:hypothetical protein JR316_0008938 [Psilocybe cubensis]KAH9478483.1 hypothetical protein JR316_0008938 [Psilocybe cubensis]